MRSIRVAKAGLFGSIAVVGAAIIAAACGSSGVAGGAACNDGGACPPGSVCNAQGVCVPTGSGGSSATGGMGGGGGSTGGVGASGGSSGGGGVVDPTNPGAQPPADPGAPPPTGAPQVVLAFRKFFLGDTTRDGITDPHAWKSYGFNIDGIVSTSQGSNHCAPYPGATKSMVQPDGIDGIDNSYGANLVPVIGALSSNPSETITQSISDGDWTIILRLDALSSTPDQSGILGALYVGAPRGTPPYWDGSDAWPVQPEYLNNGDLNQPKVAFPGSYVAGGTWVSGPPTTISLSLGTQGFLLPFTIQRAVISMYVYGTGSSAYATQGTIGGVMPTEPFVAELKKIAGAFDPTLCVFSSFEAIANQIRQASDIMSDGTNGDPTKTCDAISIGLGFDASSIVLGGVAAPEPPPPDPCAP